jgi:hypothetical protein
MKKWDRSIGPPRRGRSSVGTLRTVLNGEPRTPGAAGNDLMITGCPSDIGDGAGAQVSMTIYI